MPCCSDIHSGLTQKYLRSVLHYDPATGEFRWLAMQSTKAAILVGQKAGSFHKPTGYWRICIKRRIYRACRLAWLYQTGSWPHGDVDHINGFGADDRWENLRDVTPSLNAANQRTRSNNKSGSKGVYFEKARQKWVAAVMKDYKSFYRKRFDTMEEAQEAYRINASIAFGEHARYH